MDALHFAAHSLKSSSSNIGALRLSSLAQELESLDAENGAGSVAEILDQVKIEFEKVKEALKTYLLEIRAKRVNRFRFRGRIPWHKLQVENSLRFYLLLYPRAANSITCLYRLTNYAG